MGGDRYAWWEANKELGPGENMEATRRRERGSNVGRVFRRK